MAEMPQAGIAIGIVANGEVIHLKGYGVSSVETEEEVDEHTLFAIASNSKAFTATALAILVDQDKIGWTDKVIDHIPEFRMYNPYVTANFTIVDLLTHRSGLGLGAGDLMFFPDGGDFTIEDVIGSFQYQEPVSAFRTKYDYDNLLYLVAGELIHRVSGKAWPDFIEDEIMAKISMNGSFGTYRNISGTDNVAAPHKVEEDRAVQIPTYVENEGFEAAGAIYSNVNDLCKWMMLHLNEGRYGDSLEHEMFTVKSHGEMWKIHTNTSFSAKGLGYYNSHYGGYGLGFGLSDRKGYTIIQHSGGLPGMLSMVTMIPELNVGIVVLTNTSPGGYSYATLTNEVIDEFIDAGDRDWIAVAKGALAVGDSTAEAVVDAIWRKVDSSSQVVVTMDDYMGTYEDDWFGKVEIFDKNGVLWMNCVRSPKLIGQMHFYNANTFAVDWEYDEMECDAFATFQIDEHGKAQSIKMKGISPSMDFSFDFHDLDLKRVEH